MEVTASDKYSLLNRDNLTQPIQAQLPPKEKSFTECFFCNFSNLNEILNFFKKKDHTHS